MAECLLKPLDCRFGDILVKGARQRAHREDALDRSKLECAKRRGVAEREVDLLGRITLAQVHAR